MARRIMMIVLFMFACGNCFGAPVPVSDLLKAPFVESNKLLIEPSIDMKTMTYSTSLQDHPIDKIEDNQIFAVNDRTNSGEVKNRHAVGIYIKNLNPIKTQFEIDNKGLKESLIDISRFNKSLADFAIAIPALNKSVSSGSSFNFALEINSSESEINETCDFSDQCEKLKCLLLGLYEALKTKVDVRADIKGWIDQKGGESEIKALIKEIKDKRVVLEDDITKIKGILTAIESITAETPCTLNTKEIAFSTRISSVAIDVQNSKQEAVDIYKKLEKQATVVANSQVPGCEWLSNDYYFCTVDGIDYDSIKSSTIKLGTYTTSDSEPYTYQVDKSMVKNIRLIKKQRFYREIGAAVVWSGLKYPKWSTRQVGTTTVVAKTSDFSDPIHAAITLNAVYSQPIIDDYMYPVFQIGVASAKDYPALLAGGGIRIFGDTSFLLTGGVILGWSKDLKNLKEGDAVTGNADVEANLETKLFPSWYVGIQYNF